MRRKTDVVLINPGDKKQVYQELGKELTAIEPPYWITVIASYLRNKGFDVNIIDANAENLLPDETASKVNEIDPLLAAVIVYGSQPSASTQNMTIAGKICTAIKTKTSAKVAIGGLHPSALPGRTIEDEDVDFVIMGEGHLTLKGLLDTLRHGKNDYSLVPGLWYYDREKTKSNQRAPLIQNMDEGLPAAAWDLLPMRKYRAHNWHCFDNIEQRMPYGAIYTSLGCPYSCIFCCINAPFGKSGIRYRSPELVVEEIGLLTDKYGIKNIKIADELFILNEKHYMTIVDLVIQKGFDINLWAYARIDTIKYENLNKMKKAGINWLGLGIESASNAVRDGVNKQLKRRDIIDVVRQIQSAGIRVGANYLFGLPDDTHDTMQETLDMALKLNTEWANFYCAMAYPGSKLYVIALQNDWKLPESWDGFSQHSFGMLPLSTRYASAREVLKFRDDAFHVYFENTDYLNMIGTKFGSKIKSHIHEMTKIRLKRRLLEN
ncbi:radical SAM protein [Candidatus Brocadia pituitae]|nr:radical SAM protein [Candidatus Brocadia pituitae]